MSKEERKESNRSKPTFDDIKEAYQQAVQAENLLEQQVELLEEIEPIERLAEANLPTETRSQVIQILETVREKIAQAQFDEARELADEAERIVKSSVDYLANEAESLTGTASKRHEQGDFETAIDKWEEAIETHQEALSLAPKLDQDDRIPELQESLANVEQHRDRSEMYDIMQEGQGQVDDAERALEEGKHEQATEAYENALSIYARAHEVADEHGFEEESRIVDSLARIEQRLQAAHVSRIEVDLEEANRLLQDGEHTKAEEWFEEIVDDIDETDIDDAETAGSLRKQAQEGHLETQIEIGRAKIEQAESQFEKRDYYAARETFEETREYLEQVLSLASVYNFVDEKEKITRLVHLCSENADQARQALYETGTETPKLNTLDDIDATDITLGHQDEQQVQPQRLGGAKGNNPHQEYEFDRRAFIDRESNDRIGQTLPDHERLDLIGAGGNARVWHVRLEETGEEAALKIPRWEGTLSKEVVERFLREAETWARIDDHPNIVTVYSWGFAAQPWLLMEYMQDGDLRPHVGSIPQDGAFDLLIGVADALQYARGVDHLDIKPENILLDGEWVGKLADWGLAKAAFRHDQTDTRMGISPPYAAPEQIDRSIGDLDHRTDIYQLGVTGYELLCGQLPFDPSAPASLEQRILSGNPRPPSEINPTIPEEVDQVLLRAMATDPENRYEAPVQFRDALEEIQKASTRSG